MKTARRRLLTAGLAWWCWVRQKHRRRGGNGGGHQWRSYAVEIQITATAEMQLGRTQAEATQRLLADARINNFCAARHRHSGPHDKRSNSPVASESN